MRGVGHVKGEVWDLDNMKERLDHLRQLIQEPEL